MYSKIVEQKLARLNFEDYIWLFYGCLTFINIIGNYYEKEYLKTNIKYYNVKAKEIDEMVLILVLIIYLYILFRNYNNYKMADYNMKEVYLIRVIGTVLLIIGIFCFIYYQDTIRKYN